MYVDNETTSDNKNISTVRTTVLSAGTKGGIDEINGISSKSFTQTTSTKIRLRYSLLDPATAVQDFDANFIEEAMI